jgi:hypothetical protein
MQLMHNLDVDDLLPLPTIQLICDLSSLGWMDRLRSSMEQSRLRTFFLECVFGLESDSMRPWSLFTTPSTNFRWITGLFSGIITIASSRLFWMSSSGRYEDNNQVSPFFLCARVKEKIGNKLITKFFFPVQWARLLAQINNVSPDNTSQEIDSDAARVGTFSTLAKNYFFHAFFNH